MVIRFVVCVDATDIRRPTLYTTNGTNSDVPIFQCAQATTAAPTYFSPIRIRDRWLADGGLAFNNPTEIAMRTVGPSLWGKSFSASAIVSIGPGEASDIELQVLGHGIHNIFGILSLLKTLVRVTTDAEIVHERVRASFETHEGPSPYFRFSPMSECLDEIALDDWASMSSLAARAKRYIAQPELQKEFALCAAALRPDGSC